MAAPAVVQSRTTTTKSTTVNVNYPAGVTSGNRVVFLLGWADDASPVSYSGSKLTSLGGIENSSNNRASMLAWYRDLDGTEGSSESFSFDSDRECTAHVIEISGHDSAEAPLIAAATTGGSRTTSPNPPSRSWTWSGDTLALAGFVFRDVAGLNSVPSGYTQVAAQDSDNKAFHVVAERDVTTSPEDPGTFSCDDDKETTSYTIVVKGAAAGGTDALLADDVESASEVTSPSVGQEHGLTATSVEATSEVTSPAVGQEHDLAATSAEAASEVTTPAVGQSHVLTADDAESASEVSTPALAVVTAITADNVEAASEVTSPALGQVHALAADDAEASSEVTSPSVGQVHGLGAADVESASEVTAPTLAVESATGLTAEDVEAASEVTSPALGQVHQLIAGDVAAETSVSVPVFGVVGWVVLGETAANWNTQPGAGGAWADQAAQAQVWAEQSENPGSWSDESSATNTWTVQNG